MSIAEAPRLGPSVIASDRPVFREVTREITDYMGPLDGARWMGLVVDYTRPQSALRATRLERMKELRTTTQEAHFKTAIAFLQTMDD